MTDEYQIERSDVWCVVPVYNNGQTVREVAEKCRDEGFPTLVVDDGSTDVDVTALMQDSGIAVLKHEVNQGKGAAILTAINHLAEKGAHFMITIDGDGQHNPEDVGNFLPALKKDPESIIIGCRDMEVDNVPERSKFGRKFSNFWLKLETGIDMPDTQSGFRAYPVQKIAAMHLKARRYDFEIEVLARGAWAGLDVTSVDIGVFYPPREERVSSFHPLRDNARISRLHLRLLFVLLGKKLLGRA